MARIAHGVAFNDNLNLLPLTRRELDGMPPNPNWVDVNSVQVDARAGRLQFFVPLWRAQVEQYRSGRPISGNPPLATSPKGIPPQVAPISSGRLDNLVRQIVEAATRRADPSLEVPRVILEPTLGTISTGETGPGLRAWAKVGKREPRPNYVDLRTLLARNPKWFTPRKQHRRTAPTELRLKICPRKCTSSSFVLL